MSEPVLQWWDAALHVVAPAGQARLVKVDASVGIKIAYRDDPSEGRAAARKQAEAEFRTLGLGRVMDLPYATVTIDVSVA